MYVLRCPCGNTVYLPESRAHIGHCSRACYESSRVMDTKHIGRMVRMGYTKRRMAEVVGLSYPQFNRRFKRDYEGRV